MNYQEYKALFEEILSSENPLPPYDQADYLTYTKLNFSRLKRWDKTMELNPEVVDCFQTLEDRQHWIIIAEPWCGDAAHIVPFLIRIAEQSDLITYEIQLRDSEPFFIESYLTNGGKSIPKLIVRDAKGNDIFTWGPRPKEAQQLMEDLKAQNADFAEIKVELQNWYNQDKGKEIYAELMKSCPKVV